MTEAMPFLQKTILLSYDPRPLVEGVVLCMRGYAREQTSVCLKSPLRLRRFPPFTRGARMCNQ